MVTATIATCGHHEAGGDARGDSGGRGRRGDARAQGAGRDDARDGWDEEGHRRREEERFDDPGLVEGLDHGARHAGAGHHRAADRSFEFTHPEPCFDPGAFGHPAEHQHAESRGEGGERDDRESNPVTGRIVGTGRASVDHASAEVVDASATGVVRRTAASSRSGIGNDVWHRSNPCERARAEVDEVDCSGGRR